MAGFAALCQLLCPVRTALQPFTSYLTGDIPLLASSCSSLRYDLLWHGAGLASLVNAALIGVVLLCLTPVFRHMPLNALAAIVITGVIGLLDFPRVLFLLKVSV